MSEQCPTCKRPLHKTIAYRKLKRVKAHLYDIARWRSGMEIPPKRVFLQVCADFKHTEIWPHYSDPEPDYYTGEVLYRPKHTNDLTDKEEQGIINWLTWYFIENKIPSHAPADNWQIPSEDSAQER